MKIVTSIFIGALAVGLPGQVCAEGVDQTSQTTLYEKWRATNHTDYVTAYASAKAYLSKYPGGPNAKELTIWLRAFEKVSKELGSQSASTPPPAPSEPHALDTSTIGAQCTGSYGCRTVSSSGCCRDRFLADHRVEYSCRRFRRIPTAIPPRTLCWLG